MRIPARARTAAPLAGLLLCLALAAPAGAVNVTEFPLIVAQSSPLGIAAGPDGNLWFTEVSGSRIGRITPAGTVTDWSTGSGISTNSRPWEITAGADGNLWFSEEVGRIGRITPMATATEFTTGISPNSGPRGIAAGPDGNVWFAEDAGRIGRITPTGVVTEFSTGITAGSRPLGITTGPDGNLWFTEQTSRIGRITPTGTITEFSAGIAQGGSPQEIAPGPDGNLWFTEREARIGRATPAGVITEFPTLVGQPRGIAAGPDGNMWFADETGRVGRITPAGAVTLYTTGISQGSFPTVIARGPDLNMWFTEASGNKIGRLSLDAEVVTGGATNVGSSAATLAGTVKPYGSRTSYVFEYGRTTAYGSATASRVVAPGAAAVPVSASVSGLQSGTLYHYRLVASSIAGTFRGQDQTFQTASSGPAGGGGSSSPADRSGPRLAVLSRSLVLGSRGRVRISLRCPLAETLGCRGTVRLRTIARRPATLGVASFRIGGGQARTVSIRLTRRARALLRKRHRITVRVLVSARDAAGNTGRTVKRVKLSRKG